MRELRLKYIIDLVSNVGTKATADAKALQQAQAVMNAAVTGTNNKFLDYNKLTLLAGKNTGTMQEIITGAANKFVALDRAMTQMGSNTSIERQLGYMQRLSQALDLAAQKTQRLRTAAANGIARAPETVAAVAAGAYGAERMMLPPLKAYATLEQATMDLRVAMTDAKGVVAPAFAAISKEAIALGNELPGTTKDFMRSALALKANGTPDSVIAGGGLRSAAYLGVLLGMDQEAAAITVAKTREAYGLKEDELVPAANAMQKARFAFGLKPSDLLAANTYMSGTLNSQHWSGLGNMREVLGLQGLAAQRGIDGSVFGTDLKDFMLRLSMMDARLAKKSPEARHVRQLMHSFGINLDVVGEDGYLRSPTRVLQEMQKFNALKPQDRNAALQTIFGMQGGQMAQLMVQTDPAKLAGMLATGDNQGDLNMRLAMTTSTLQNRFEALKGTLENLLAQIGTQAGNGLKGPLDSANSLFGGPVQGFFEDHPAAGTAGLLGAGGLGAWLVGRLGSKAIAGLLGRSAAAAGAEGAAATAASGLGLARFGVAGAGLFAAIQGYRVLDAASDLYNIGNREGVQLNPNAAARMTLLPPGTDFMSLTRPGGVGAGQPSAFGNALQIGEGRLAIDVTVHDDRITATTAVNKPMSLVRIDNGNTNPAGYGMPR